jgi:hypothetical protein
MFKTFGSLLSGHASYMFQTVLVHHYEQLYKLYITYTGICDVQLIKLLMMMD